MWATSLTTSVQVIGASPTNMSVYIGEAIVLYCVALLNIVAFVNDGWICGRLCSQLCLESYVMLVVLGCLSVALLLSLIAAVLQTAAACINPDSSSSHRLHVSVKVLACLVAIADVFAIFYYYSQLGVRMWNHIIGGVCAGMAVAIAITELTYGHIAS
ncbi:unnamed protein product [Taenia asiatica]|uniref:MARVEL domain-containing protein n=1 Tax=Taenia asiatica TaxID=60517 RepID=A0A0R3WFD8_TAEAS|nr:unnamed protein product [Taenia asiatica]